MPTLVHCRRRRCYLVWRVVRYDMIRYDTIRYIYVRSRADEMASLVIAHGTERKNKEKLKTKPPKPSSSVETVRAKVREGSPGGRSEKVKLRGIGFVKQVGSKPVVKETGSYGLAEWWIQKGSDDEGIGESEMEELVPVKKLIQETRWSIMKGAISDF